MATRPTELRMDLTQFIDTYKDAIAKEVINSYPPLYRQSQDDRPMPELLRSPMGLQADAIRGASLSMSMNRGTILVGEMGTGKTFIALAAAHMANFKRPLVLCPPHLTRKWKREVEMTIPGVPAAIVSSITDLERLRAYDPGTALVTIMSRERAKLSYRWKPSYLLHYTARGNRRPGNPRPGETHLWLSCPDCYRMIADKEGVPLSESDMSKKRLTCSRCNSPLWTADRTGPARYPLADYVKNHMPRYFDLLIADEFHEFKAKGSAQGIAAGVLAEACGTCITLTGTLMGGYASTLFHLLYRFSPDIRDEFKYHDESRWVSRYGFVEKRYTEKDSSTNTEDGRSSRRKSYNTRIKEIPGITPPSLFHLIGNSIFLRLTDVTASLPPYDEQVSLTRMDTETHGAWASQQKAYSKLESALKTALTEALAKGSMHLMGTYLQALLAYPDACMKGEIVVDPLTGMPIASIDPLPENTVYPKEKALIDLVKQERSQNRRVLVYVTHTETRDITGRLQTSLTEQGFNAAVLKASTVPPDKREQWMMDKVASGTEVVITNPRLFQTGLDLVDFPTIAWFETDYSVYTMRQASRRSWRIGQKRPVKVIYMAYAGTLQSQALNLIARKMKTSLAMEGELPEEGLSAFGDDGKDLMYSLARRMLDTNIPDDQSLFGANPVSTDEIDRLLADAQEAQNDSDQFLVDNDWTLPPLPVNPGPPLLPEISKPEPGPEPEREPELVPAAHAPEPAQQSLFPLEDFIAQGPFTMRTKKGAKVQPGYSLFDWALENRI